MMIPRKKQVRSPKFCSKASCSPQQVFQKHPLRVHLSHMFARRPSLWCSCHPLLPVTAGSSTLSVPCPSSCTQPLHTLLTSSLEH